MAAKKNPLSDKAYEMYKQGMKLVDIAAALNVPSGTVRRWKSTQNWDGERSECVANKENERSDFASWMDIEHEYVTDIRKKPCSLESLAKKYDIPIQTITDQSAKGRWSEKRREYKEKTKRKALERSSDKDAERIVRLMQIADMATDKAEQALGELEMHLVHNKTKTKTVEYKEHAAPGKPTKEVIKEDEHIETVAGPIDRLGLSQVTNALKNIRDLYALPAELDGKKYRAEYERKRAEVDDNSGEEILKNMQALAEVIKDPRPDRSIEDYE